MKNVILFGYGNMGSSIGEAWLSEKLNFKFFVVEKNYKTRSEAIKKGFKSFQNFDELANTLKVENFDIIFLAVKPQQMSEATEKFHLLNYNKTLFVSIAAGLSFSWFKSNINENIKVVRAMPNLPVSVRRGVTGYCKSKNLTIDDEKNINILLSAFGKLVFLHEECQIDVVTAISGSGPAYIFYFIEILELICKKEGLGAQNAKTLAVETLLGSAKLLQKSDLDPQTLRKNVTSPGGTTEAGLQILASKKHGLYDLLNSSIKNAQKRASDLNKNN